MRNFAQLLYVLKAPKLKMNIFVLLKSLNDEWVFFVVNYIAEIIRSFVLRI